MNVKQAQSIIKVGRANSKMPGTTFSITSKVCKVGSKLAKVEGSVCHKCYAMKIEKFRVNVSKAWAINLDQFNYWVGADPDLLISSFVYQINRYSKGYHRWFDSGDLQSLRMLRVIVQVCRETPKVKHWLPTREAGIVREYLATNLEGFPDNLVVRLSAPMIDSAPVVGYAHTSTVHTKGAMVHGHACPARQQGNKCGDCRACWDTKVRNVSYERH